MTPVNVAEWEWASQDHPPAFHARKVWRAAVATVAASAKRGLPEAHHRIENAVKLILAGDVELFPNGTAKVASQSDPQATHEIKGSGCTCPDALYRAKDGWCKHLLAALIVKRAATLVKQQLEVSAERFVRAQKRVSASTTAAPRFEDVSASCTLTFPVSGVDVMLTLHGKNEQALFPRVRHALAWAKALGAYRIEYRSDDDKHGVELHRPQQSNQA